MSEPAALAGRELLLRHPELEAAEVREVERQAQGQGVMAERARKERVVDGLRHLLTAEQLGAASAVIYLDPDAIVTLGEDRLQFALDRIHTDADPPSRGTKGGSGSHRSLPRGDHVTDQLAGLRCASGDRAMEAPECRPETEARPGPAR